MTKFQEVLLKAKVKKLEKQMRMLATILHTHVRTDLPPDAALPKMKRFLFLMRASK